MKAIAIGALVLIVLVAAGLNEALTSRYELPRTYFATNAGRTVSGTCTQREDLERLCVWYGELAAVPENERPRVLERIGTGRAHLCTYDVIELFGAIGGVSPADKARLLREAARDEKWHDNWRRGCMPPGTSPGAPRQWCRRCAKVQGTGLALVVVPTPEDVVSVGKRSST